MKKVILSIVILITILLVSCTRDNSFDNFSNFNLDPSNLNGTIESGRSITLDAKISYKLTGALIIEEGAELTIPEGTTIKATGGTSAYIASSKGATININGTSANPVVMTSTTKEPGSWGGLVICGYAITNLGVDALSEVGRVSYGGTNNEDSSGSITYLRVEYTGAKFSASKEFNGISLFAVGSGTTFENISSINSSDDGIEFFGGAVNAKNLVSINSEDDSIDFTDGFTGTIDGVYISGVTKSGIEGSNSAYNGNAIPVTTTTVKNVSIIVNGLGASEGAIYFKEGGGNITYKNVYVDGVSLGIKVKFDDIPANERIAANGLIINQIQFVNNKYDFELGVPSVIIERENNGAGNADKLPDWAIGWAN